MPRPSTDCDKRLLDAARAMLAETGLAGLSQRAVARRAGVNLGMFHYHFGTKERFLRRLLQDVYEEFFARLSLETKDGSDPVKRLRRALVEFGRFARDQRVLVCALAGEAIKGDKLCADFFRVNMPRHFAVLAGLMAEGQRRRRLKRLPMPVAVSFALGAMGSPNIVYTVLERLGRRPDEALGRLKKDFLSDRAIELRADIVLAGLRP
jgi:AcrR family transcriptional regulator